MGIPVIAIEKRRLSNVRKPNIVRFGQQSFFDISQFFYDDIKQANETVEKPYFETERGDGD
jgi:hypothetical protein